MPACIENGGMTDRSVTVSVFVSQMCLLCVMSPSHHFEGIVELSSELKVYRAVQ